MSDQRRFSIVDHRPNYVDSTLKMKEISKVRFSTLHNIDTMSVSSIEATLNERCTTSTQPFFNVTQR